MPANSIGGVVVDFVTNTAQFEIDLGKVQKAAESAAAGVQRSGQKIGASLKGNSDDATAMSANFKQRLAYAGDDVTKMFDSINAGQAPLRALLIEMPKIADAIGTPWLVAAGVVVSVAGAVATHLLGVGEAQKRAAEQAKAHQEQLDGLAKAMSVDLESTDKFAAGVGGATAAQKDLLKADLAQRMEDDAKAVKFATDALDKFVAAKIKVAAASDPDLGYGAGMGEAPSGDNESKRASLVAESNVQLKEMHALYQSGTIDFALYSSALRGVMSAQGDGAAATAKASSELLRLVDAQQVAKAAAEQHTAAYHFLLMLLGDTAAFDASDQDIMRRAAALDMATAAIKRYDIAGRNAADVMAFDKIKGSGLPGADDMAQKYLIHQIAINKSEDEQVEKEGELQRLRSSGLSDAAAKRAQAASQSTLQGLGEEAQYRQRILDLQADIALHVGDEKQNQALIAQDQAKIGELEKKRAETARQHADSVARQREGLLGAADAGAKLAAEEAKVAAARREGVLRTRAEEGRALAGPFTRYAEEVAAQAAKMNEGQTERVRLQAEINAELAAETSHGEARAAIEQKLGVLRAALLRLDQTDAEALDKQTDANQRTLDSLHAQLAALQGRADPMAAVVAAGQAAADRIRMPSLEQADQPGGPQAFDDALAKREDARSTAELIEAQKLLKSVTGDLQDPTRQYGEALDVLNGLYGAGKIGLAEYEKDLDALGSMLPLLQKRFKEAQLQAKEAADLADPNALRGGVAAGIDQLVQQYGDANKTIAQGFTDTFGTASGAFTTFIMTGKADWQGMVASIIQDLAKLAIEYALVAAVRAAAGVGGGVLGLGGLFGGGGGAGAGGFGFGDLLGGGGGSAGGFATGGAFTVGGDGGVDSQVVRLRATPGEVVRVTPPANDDAHERRAPEPARVAPAPERAPAPEVARVAPAPERAPAPEVARVAPAPERAPAPEVVRVMPAPERAPAPEAPEAAQGGAMHYHYAPVIQVSGAGDPRGTAAQVGATLDRHSKGTETRIYDNMRRRGLYGSKRAG